MELIGIEHMMAESRANFHGVLRAVRSAALPLASELFGIEYPHNFIDVARIYVDTGIYNYIHIHVHTEYTYIYIHLIFYI